MRVRWIDASNRLPRDGERVFIVTKSPYAWTRGGEDKVNYSAATFRKGKVPKSGEAIGAEDQHGNNLKPYNWVDGPMQWFGQDVLYWMPTIEPVALRKNPEFLRRRQSNLQWQQKAKRTSRIISETLTQSN